MKLSDRRAYRAKGHRSPVAESKSESNPSIAPTRPLPRTPHTYFTYFTKLFLKRKRKPTERLGRKVTKTASKFLLCYILQAQLLNFLLFCSSFVHFGFYFQIKHGQVYCFICQFQIFASGFDGGEFGSSPPLCSLLSTTHTIHHHLSPLTLMFPCRAVCV